jgi:oligopeptidase B
MSAAQIPTRGSLIEPGRAPDLRDIAQMTASGSEANPPVAPCEPHIWDLHGVRRDDDYAWMARDEAKLLDYLTAERDYYDAATAGSGPLRAELFAEMSDRLPASEDSVSWRAGDWLYFTRTIPGRQYPQFCREAAADQTAHTQVLLDLNELAESSAYLALGIREVSPNGHLLAYSVDLDGDEAYELRVRDLRTGEDRPDVVARSYYGCAWSADSRHVFYTVHDSAYRPYQVVRHRIGTPVTTDVVVYEETDERFEVEIAGSRSGALIVITSRSRNTSEIRLLASDDVDSEPWVVAERRTGVEYSVDHVRGEGGGELYVVTNDGATEFRLMRAPLKADRDDWIEVIAENPAERLVAVATFTGHVVVTFRRDGYRLLRIVDLATGGSRDHGADIPAGTIRLSCQDDEREPVYDRFESTAVTVVVESLVEPPSWWSINLTTGARQLRKTQSTPTYEPTSYRTTRISVAAQDGTAVPVTLAYRSDLTRDGSAPCLLYGYGAYEASIDPYYDPSFASLLDRGVVYAIAHIRGGGEGGRQWWLQGQGHHKRNTFTDFIAAADGLVEHGWVDGSRIASRGASAGGLLQGAALSMAPLRWRAVVAEVPFVDVVTTMLDASLPLTVAEWDEWGDPRTAADFTYMLSYSPYDNVPDGERPDLLATGSLHDSRVMVHEPAKWVAKLRATRSDRSQILFRAEVGSAAHGGPSGRYDRLRYQSEILAFVLDKIGAPSGGASS